MVSDGRKLLNVPNWLSLLRIILSVVLIIFSAERLAYWFWILYSVCAVSDFFDGFIARKTGTVTRTGQLLDSVGDIFFVAAVAVHLVRTVFFSKLFVVWICAIILLRLASQAVALVRFHRLALIHTWLNKATGLTVYLLPLLLLLFSERFVFVFACILATIASVEELLINLTSARPEPDRGTLLNKRPTSGSLSGSDKRSV